MALAAVALIAIGVMCVAIGKQKKETDELTDANVNLNEAQRDNAMASAEAAEAHAKLTDTWIEEMGTMDSLIAKYNELSEAERKASGIGDELLEKRDDLIDVYKDLADSIPEEQ
jgi:hypothetical protein